MDILAELFRNTRSNTASDLHLTIGRPPMVRIAGRLIPSGYETELGPDETKSLIYSVLTDDQKAVRRGTRIGLSIGIPGVAVPRKRFHATGLRRRRVPDDRRNIPVFDELGPSDTVRNPRPAAARLVVVTGPPVAASPPRWPP
jgi:twitching motility protein PilT